MTQTATADAPARPKLSIRTGSSRKLLERKARADGPPAGEAVEASFPVPEDESGNDPGTSPAAASDEAAAALVYGPPEPATAASAPPMPAAQPWSAEDESAFQTLAARRKAAGYQRRGRDVSDQTITLGAVAPNPGTVVAVVVGLVAERGGSVSRSELVVAMADATFPHAKARPDDKGWCQGYVAGAVRNGFLAMADADAAVVAA